MKSFYAKGILLAMGALSAMGVGSHAQAQYPTYGAPSKADLSAPTWR